MFQPKLNFTAEEDEKLIEAVAAHPAVYDLKHALYKDQRAKDNIWVVIAGEVDRSVGDCKKRWKNIKDTFDRKNREIKKTGSKAPLFKKAKILALQESLSFLRTLDDERETFSNMVEDSEATDEIDIEPENTGVSQQESHVAILTPQPQATSSAGSVTHRSKSPENKKKMNYREKMCFAIEKRAKERDAMMKELLAKEDESDDISLFFQSIAKTVLKFPPHLQQRAKLDTLQLVSRIQTDMWSSHLGTSASRQPNMPPSLSPCSTSTYSDISRPLSTSNQTDMWSSHPGTYASTQPNMPPSPSPCSTSTYSDISRPPSIGNQSELCSEVALPRPSPEHYSQHSADIQIILKSAVNMSDPILHSYFTK